MMGPGQGDWVMAAGVSGCSGRCIPCHSIKASRTSKPNMAPQVALAKTDEAFHRRAFPIMKVVNPPAMLRSVSFGGKLYARQTNMTNAVATRR